MMNDTVVFLLLLASLGLALTIINSARLLWLRNRVDKIEDALRAGGHLLPPRSYEDKDAA